MRLAIGSLLFAILVVPAAPQVLSGHASDHIGKPKHFESGIGFSYGVPPDLAVISSKQFDRATRAEAFSETTSKQEMQSIDCTQYLLVAENRDESKILYFVAVPQGCAGGKITDQNLAQLGQRSVGELEKRFAIVSPEFGAFTAGNHVFWAMRSEMTPHPPQNPNSQIAYSVTYTQDAVIECMLLARTREDLKAPLPDCGSTMVR